MVQETSLPPTLDAAAWGAMPVRCVLVVFVFSLASTTVSSQNVATTSATLLDSLVVRVQFRREHEAVLFLLCDDSRCTKLSLASNVYESKGGLMVYHAENCSRWGSDCEVYDSTWFSSVPFPAGEMVFNLERRDSDFIVWQPGDRDFAIVLPVEASQTQLIVRPVKWGPDLSVQFSDGTMPCGEDKIPCSNNNCIWFWQKCDGNDDCEDRTDETPSLCTTPNRTMAVGDSILTHVQYKKEHLYTMFLMCDGATCSTMDVTNSTSGPGSLEFVAYSGCNQQGAFCSNRTHLTAGISFLPGNLTFVVNRRAAELTVWLQGYPDKAVSVPVDERQNQLRIRPWSWQTSMPVLFTDPHRLLEAGDSLLTYVHFKSEHRYVMFVVCDDDGSCSRLDVTNSSMGIGSLEFVAHIRCNSC